jgi:putative membrane protein
MWGMMEGYGWGWAWWGIAHMLLWWVLIILGIVVLVRWLGRSTTGLQQPVAETALEILKSRYVRGEIGKEEFEQKKRDVAG